ncbi:MAG: OFA family MFS transporter, partial [Dehalococcoidales bacterium]|nr:OFA family MFS transporter [Dehalococcoidales bacterium]
MAKSGKAAGPSRKATGQNPVNTRVFGMAAENGRWIFVILGLVVNLCLGAVYSWSVFRKPIEKLFSVGAMESSLPFMLFLAFFAVLMPFGGRLLQRFGPKTIGIVGGILVALGWMLSYFASSITVLCITYGLIAGSGVGLVYGGPIAVSTRWFPDKRGLAVGLTVGGFGLSALIMAPLGNSLIGSYGVLATFGILGIAFLVLTVLLSIPLRFPPADWKPAGWTPPKAAAAAVNLSPSGMVKKSAFYGLWVCFLIGTISGLMAIGIASPVGTEIIKLSSTTAAVLVSVFAIFNGGGRPIFGWLTDRITPRYAAVLSFVLVGLASAGMLVAGEGSTVLYVICFAAFWMSLGGWLAIAPTSTATFFGSKDYTSNYGIVFTAYGVGAIIGSLMSGQLRDIFGSYTYAFYPTAGLAVIGLVLALILLKP